MALGKFVICGVAALALAACGERNKTDARAPEAAAGPELGAFGVETRFIDASIAPGDDFYRHVNGGWLDTFQIPDDFSSYGSFTILFERAEERVKKIVEDAAAANAAPGAVEQKIGGYFAAYVDVAAIGAKGLAPLAEDFARFDSLRSHEDVARALADPALGGVAPIGLFVAVDSKRPDRYIAHVTQGGLGMPNRDYYREAKFADKQARYRAYVEQILSLAGVPDAGAKAAEIYEVERRIAEIHWSPEKRRERDLTYNLKTLDELKGFAPEAPWDAMLEGADLGAETEFVVREDDAVQNLAKIFVETPVDVWRDYLKFQIVNAYADVLPAPIDAAHFAFFDKELRGTLKQKERWKRGVAAVNAAMGEAVGRVYVARHFPPESKAAMDALVADLRAALGERLEALSWMSEATKREARGKLEKFLPKIGYPQKWRDYSGLEVAPGDAYANAKRAARFAWDYSLSKLGKPVDRLEWTMTPQTVNASYSPPLNAITFPAAILQPPFFDPKADAAVNYGAVGAVIGHEIGHGFDDQGRKSDGDGVLRDWWTSDDAGNFNELAERLGAQYAAYEPIPGFPVDPKRTMGENIGDLGGLAIAYRAYRLSLRGAEAPVIDGFTGDQRFFMAFAQIWKRIVREEQLKNQVATDPHSPAEFRVNGVVRNMDSWYAAFDVGPEEALYLPPEERVQIW